MITLKLTREGGKHLVKATNDFLPASCSICGKDIKFPFYYCLEFNQCYCDKDCCLASLDFINGKETERKINMGCKRACGSPNEIHEHHFITNIIKYDDGIHNETTQS